MLDTAEHGVIYISWGSMVKADTLSVEAREGILRALGKFKQRVIWKYENETLPNQPSNVIIRKWMPQREILCMLCFIFDLLSAVKFNNNFISRSSKCSCVYDSWRIIGKLGSCLLWSAGCVNSILW